ncbi:nucleoside hydrolase [Microbacterium sp. SORGH_AS_0888]|uniref:nucleoside hydrolase n=1 Tax=Microbacterium sp. SORGH_AS_0888 TaxID=3041791 RepID=UPI00277E8122|nr:nucleoside hydrolase [Microbacterium sp. SORGH_AS_0888]MDQ1130323.1 purine nucleosidase [Microbacterium sp. SORGH_AS_0888]
MTARPTLVFTDPGQDQAAALYAMLAAPEAFDVRAVIASAGNIDVDTAARNARMLLDAAGRSDIPVHRGNPAPLAGSLVTASHVHGATGLDGYDFPEPSVPPDPEDGASAAARLLAGAAVGEYTVVCLSPMTTLAAAILQDPGARDGVGQIIAFLGAYFEGGNITPAAEFNCFVDPHAAHVVLTSGVPLTLLSLDVSHGLRATPERLRSFEGTGTVCGGIVADLLRFSEAFDLRKYGWDGAPLHGPSVPLALLEPGLFSGRRVSVRVETTKGPAYGALSVDWWSVTDESPNALYLAGADADGYFALLTELYGRLP